MNPSSKQFVGSGPIPGWVSRTGSNRERAGDPAGYRASEALAQAVNVALALERPLLVTGEPGTGKTELADRIAAELGRGDVLRFDTKSSSVASELFYRFDTVRQFGQSQLHAVKGVRMPEPQEFLHLQALGKAIVMTLDPNDVQKSLGRVPHTAPRSSVVLIDELDKAPRDFPNDLLNQIANWEFEVPELSDCKFQADPEHTPFILLTSNSEKQLPEAFLRRCVYHHIDFPNEEELREILVSRLGTIDTQSPSFDSLLKLFDEIRKDVDLMKRPSTSELLDWLRALRRAGLDTTRPWEDQRKAVQGCLGSLLKTETDLKRWSGKVTNLAFKTTR